MKSKEFKIVIFVDRDPSALPYDKLFKDFHIISIKKDWDLLKKIVSETNNVDLIFFDISGNNSELLYHCYELRKNDTNSYLSLYAYTDSKDDFFKLALFHAGFDDVIDYNIKPRIIQAKINALFNKKSSLIKNNPIETNFIKIDKERFTVLINNREVILPKKEFELIDLLMSDPGKVFTRVEIMNHLWKNNNFHNDRIIDVYIRKLRSKINDKMIGTVKGVGYYIVS